MYSVSIGVLDTRVSRANPSPSETSYLVRLNSTMISAVTDIKLWHKLVACKRITALYMYAHLLVD